VSGGGTRFGIQLHGSFPMPEYPLLARAVEAQPFAELTVHDVVWWRPVWPVLTLVAAGTERVAVGPDVTHPYLRHPVVTAANVAALDELSGGRAVLGLGRGSLLQPLGISRAGSEAAVRDLAAAVRRYLAGEDPAANFLWRPPRPRVPTFVGAFGARMVESALAWADEVRPPGIWDTRFFADLKRRVAGRAPLGCDIWAVVDRDREKARELGREVLARYLAEMPALTAFYGVDPAERPIPDATLDLFVAAGTPADVARGLDRLLAAGPASVTFSGRLGLDPYWAIEQLGRMVA
jgi:5,10-methylenetetrahydromethanopterin reductase